jgi:hypothetical protein
MDPVHEDCYVVYLRLDSRHDEHPDQAEQPIAVCSSYGEARRAQREFHLVSPRPSVIRFIGPSGGGD